MTLLGIIIMSLSLKLMLLGYAALITELFHNPTRQRMVLGNDSGIRAGKLALIFFINNSMQFDRLVEKILTEMPYIEVDNQIIDLEVELYKKEPEEFIKKIKSILQGNKVVDKYNSSMQLTTPEQKQEFLKRIKLNYIIRGIIPGNLIDSL